MRIAPTSGGWTARVLGSALVLLTVLNPLAVALHEVGHAAHASAPAFRQHDAAAHHAHRPIDAHDRCALCTYAKSVHALVAGSPRAASDVPSAPIAVPPTLGVVPLLLATLPAPRAPPLAS